MATMFTVIYTRRIDSKRGQHAVVEGTRRATEVAADMEETGRESGWGPVVYAPERDLSPNGHGGYEWLGENGRWYPAAIEGY